MKHLRKYIRQVLLTEAMKTPADLPDNVIIVIETVDNDYMEVYYADANDPSDMRTNPSGSITIYPTEPDREGECNNAWVVGGSDADDGWGPLLYDVAIEWATQNGGGLISDRGSVSDEAQGVWNYYMRNRSDVTAHQLDDLNNSLTPEEEDNCDQDIGRGTVTGMYDTWVDSALSKRYTKPPTTMNALGKKLVIL